MQGVRGFVGKEDPEQLLGSNYDPPQYEMDIKVNTDLCVCVCVCAWEQGFVIASKVLCVEGQSITTY